MSDTYRDKIRAALADTDSGWGEATGDGDANPDYIDTLTEGVMAVRDEEWHNTIRQCAELVVAQRDDVADFLGLPRSASMEILLRHAKEAQTAATERGDAEARCAENRAEIIRQLQEDRRQARQQADTARRERDEARAELAQQVDRVTFLEATVNEDATLVVQAQREAHEAQQTARALTGMEGRLVRCPAHLGHAPHLSSHKCPWCELARVKAELARANEAADMWKNAYQETTGDA